MTLKVDSPPIESPRPSTAARFDVRRVLGHETATLLGVVAALVITFTWLSPGRAFLSQANLRNITLDTSQIMVLAAGMTFVIISANIDLSIGSVLIFSSVVFTTVLDIAMSDRAFGLGLGLLLAVPAAVVAGAGWGFINGWLTAKLAIPSFVVTLGTLSIVLGLAQVVTGGLNAPDVPIELQAGFGLGSVLGIPYLVILSAAVTGALWFILSKTRFGLRTYALGASFEGSRRAGINVVKHSIAVLVLMGALSGIAGIMDVARFNTTSIDAHTQDALVAIAAVIIGGTSLFGGKGRMSGTIIGAFIPVILRNGLVLAGVAPFWQNVGIGSILIIAVFIDQRRRSKQTT